jgi:hypothetical protein
MMADRWRGILWRVDDGVAPGKGYRDFLSCFGIPVGEFPLTYRDELIDEVSVWGGKGQRLRFTAIFIWRTILLHSHQHDHHTFP